MTVFTHHFATLVSNRFTITGLKFLIVVWSIAIIAAAYFIDNPYILGLILAYEVLP